jgi:soluble lytic murein transglycosylase-like protein
MRWPRARGLAGAALAAAAFAVAVAAPAPLDEPPRAVQPVDPAFAEPGVAAGAGVVERLERQLFLRMPHLGDASRRLLALTIAGEAEDARIDPLLVLALIQVESGFDPRALSNRGARGLMQLREPTMRRELERSGLALDDPHDPVANVQAGVRYLRRLLDAFGREEVALMAYNAGPNRILGYLRAGDIPDRFHVYPRRVAAELRRLRRSVAVPAGPALAEARVVPQPQ